MSSLSLDDSGELDLEKEQPDFVLNTVSIPFATWQRIQLLKDTYEMSHELLLQGYRDTTILQPSVLRHLVALHEICQATMYAVLQKPLRNAKLEKLLPKRLVDYLRALWAPNRAMFWQVYAAAHLLNDRCMFEYFSAFVAQICRDTRPPLADNLVSRLVENQEP